MAKLKNISVLITCPTSAWHTIGIDEIVVSRVLVCGDHASIILETSQREFMWNVQMEDLNSMSTELEVILELIELAQNTADLGLGCVGDK